MHRTITKTDEIIQHILELIGYLFFLIQAIYLVLLVRVSEQKLLLQNKEQQAEDLLSYNSKLENNLQEMRAMKHDLKNIFLTMGGFVSRSNDEQMKQFYQEMICPIADMEMKKNDIFVQLSRIEQSQLKAFLYYKISLGLQNGIDMKLTINVDSDRLFTIPNEYTLLQDLVRMLGILIDNALEEVAQQQEGKIEIVFCQKEEKFQIVVNNTVRESCLKQGITRGMTTKGLGRGNGLLIVEQIVNRYQGCVWNSYFQNDTFVQSITF